MGYLLPWVSDVIRGDRFGSGKISISPSGRFRFIRARVLAAVIAVFI